jgi:uncharacterized protein YndB with AHSA1/START domain
MNRLAGTDERALHLTVEVDAPVGAVWDAWTTEAGTRTFFAPDSVVDLRPGGAYEMLWDATAPVGRRGGEGNTVLAVQPERMLSVTWNAPTRFPEVRDQRTAVVVRFAPVEDDRTRVALTHVGWGEGGQWDDAFEYFEEAWGAVVLPRLQRRFVEGPVDWSARA